MGKLTQVIAVYGAVVATGVAAWNIYMGRRDRGRIRIIIDKIMKDRGPKIRVFCGIGNVGRRPITLKKHGIKKEDNTVNVKHVWPKGVVLTENDPIVAVQVEFDITVENVFEMKGFFVQDLKGKEWSFSRKERQQLDKRLRKAISDHG